MKRNFINQIVFVGLLVTVLWSPLPFGSVETWSNSILEIAAFSLLFLIALQLIRGSVEKFAKSYLLAPLILSIGLAFFQLLPLKNGNPISFNPYSTKVCILIISAIIILFFLALNFFDNERRIQLVLSILIFWGGIIAFEALIQYFTSNGCIYWFKEVPGITTFGPFVNRNHYAGFMEMLVPLAVVKLLVERQRNILRIVYGSIAILMSASVILTGSRGGILSLICEFIFLFVLVWSNKNRTEKKAMFLVLAFIVFGIFASLQWFGAELLTKRFDTLESAAQDQSRINIWKQSLGIIKDYPLFGIGLGAFEQAYTKYDHSSGEFSVPQAHNDYIQILTDLGIVGGILALWFIFELFRKTLNVLRKSHSEELEESVRILSQARIIGAISGCVGMLVHSNFDFNLQIPSNALLFLILVTISTVDIKSNVLTKGIVN